MLKTKKYSQTKARLYNFIYCKLSKFKYKEKKVKNKNILVKKLNLSKKRRKNQCKKQNIGRNQSKIKRKDKFRACRFEITLVDLEKEEELDLIIDARLSKVD